MKSPKSENAKILRMISNSQTHFQKWGIVAGSLALYFLFAVLLLPMVGSPITIFSGVLVAAIGWYLGVSGGMITSLALTFINYYLTARVESHSWNKEDISGFIGGTITLFLISVVAGRLKQSLDSRANTEKQLRSRERHLSLLNQMTRTIIASQDLDTLLQNLVKDMANLLEADDCYITRWDEQRKRVIPVSSSAQLARPYSEMQFTNGSTNLTEAVLQAGHVIFVEDKLNSPYVDLQVAKQTPAHSLLGIPLIVGEHKLGAALIAFNTPHHFSAEEIKQAQQTGNQIALVLWDAQQDAELQQRLRESTELSKIAQALSETERVGLGTVLQLIVNSAKELIPATEQAVIHLLDEEQQILTAEAVIGYDQNATSWKTIKIRLNEGVAGQVIVNGTTINIADVENDERYVTYGEPPKYRSLMVAPVQINGKRLGTISVQSNLFSAFKEAESELLSALGAQAAIAIENAHLLENTQLALKESNALYSINQKLVASLDSQQLLQDVVELLQQNFSYHHVQVYVVESGTGELTLRAGSGEIGEKLKEKKHRLRAGEGIVGYTAETKTSFFTNDVDQVHFFVRNPLLPNTKSELAMPVKIGGHILGVLDIQQIPPRTFGQRDIQLVSAAADQLALALQKANLYADLQTSLQTEKAMRDQLVQNERLATMGRLLASVSHELNNPLQAIQNALFLLREEKGISQQGKQDLDIVLSESERMAALIAHLRATYRPARVEDFQPMQVNDLIEDVYALIATHLRHNEISFEFYPDPSLPVISGLVDQIRQVLLNLLMNAVEAMTTGGRLTVSTQYLTESQEILLKISDTGTGINPSIIQSIFDAFVTDKETGTGLGLTISHDIVTKHGGRIQAANNLERGATFNVWLPIEHRENQ